MKKTLDTGPFFGGKTFPTLNQDNIIHNRTAFAGKNEKKQTNNQAASRPAPPGHFAIHHQQ
jgi:hypothetical protein